MMYKTIKQFYGSKEWRKCREGYWRKQKGLCERCKQKGLIKQGEEVHHKIRLNLDNINNPSVSLNYNNLELLCSQCHQDEHKHDRTKMFSKKRYIVDHTTGVVAPIDNDAWV